MRLAAAVLTATAIAAAQSPAALSGYVLTPDWLPVSDGTVSLQFLGSERVIAIGRDGRFHVEALSSGMYVVTVSAPGLMSQRLKVAVPSSGRLRLPPIKLSTETYLRVMVRSPEGQPIAWAGIVRESFDVSGAYVPNRLGQRAGAGVQPDGRLAVGPLPRGVTVLSVDTPPFARKHLPDVRVTGESPFIDAESVTLEPGAVLNLKVVDGAGLPVADHDVRLEDGAAMSPIQIPPVRTDSKGRARFERLASGRYYLRARGARMCGNHYPTVERAVDIPRGGTVDKELVIGGRASFRLTSGGVPLVGSPVSVTSGSTTPTAPAWLRQASLLRWRYQALGPFMEAACTGVTDGDGRVTLANVPPGPARVAVRRELHVGAPADRPRGWPGGNGRNTSRSIATSNHRRRYAQAARWRDDDVEFRRRAG